MKSSILAFGALVLAATSIFGQEQPASATPTQDAFHYNQLLGRGVNLGNMLEAPREGAWGLTLKPEYFEKIRAAGFDSVRIPIRWSAHAQKAPPFTIDPAFLERVDWAIDQALKHQLVVVINIHHYDEIFEDPEGHRTRIIALWQQLARRYQKQPDRVFFELLNEPHGRLTDDRWNRLLRDLLKTLRTTNPDRIVIVGPAQWNNLSHLPQLELPNDDQRLIVTFHYYSPFQFTHQGASWVSQGRSWKDIRWTGTPQDRQAIADDLATAAAWAEREHRPLYLGEFGSYQRADMQSRARWTDCVREEAERRGISWAYWEFAAGFGVFDRESGNYRQELLQALVPETNSINKPQADLSGDLSDS